MRVSELLPHRDRWLLLDAIEQLEDERAVVLSRPIEPFELRGHFPGSLVVPGVLLIEMIAQAAGILLARRSAPEDMCGGALLGVRRMRFVRPLPPSQACRITVNLEAALRGGVMVRGEIDADGERIATGVLAVHSPEVSNAKRARTAV